ncbi:kazrin-A-like [Pungitius pungitius]|uniref:kazrin-A-like n=1 Tax=Pungitius pungitius TaxID=134920 RepID=UPI002E1365C4
MKWIRDIDLKEFADNLQGKGIHGAVMVLDPSFDTDTLAKALGIPCNKHMLHRHLYQEMKSLAVLHSSAEHSGEVICSTSPVSVSMRRSGKSPLRLRASSHSAERRPAPRVQAVPRANGGQVHTYKGVEITNV